AARCLTRRRWGAVLACDPMSALNSVPDGAGEVPPAAAAARGASGAQGAAKVLSARGLSKRYGRRKVVDALDLELSRGELAALLGTHGAGTATRFCVIVWFDRPHSGATWLGGEDISRLPMHRRGRLGLGYLAQDPCAFRRTAVRDNLMAIREFQWLTR